MKTSNIQIRLTPEQKAKIQIDSAHLGLSVSQYLLMLAMSDIKNNLTTINK